MEDIQRKESAAMVKKRVQMPTTTAEKLEVARELKEQGNSRVKDREYKKAIFSYSKVFLYTQGLPGRKKLNPETDMLSNVGLNAKSKHSIDPELEKSIRELEIACHGNIALCYMKLHDAEKVIENCQKAVLLNPLYWKGYWREASARMDLLEDYEGAIKCLDRALGVPDIEDEPKSILEKSKAKALVYLKKDEAAALKKQRSAFSGVFDKLAKAEATS